MALEGVNRLFCWVGAVVMRRDKLEFILVRFEDNFLQARRTFIVHSVMVWAEATGT